jgi:bacteriorhodopsin
MELTKSLNAMTQAVPELDTSVRLLILSLATLLAISAIVAYIIAVNYNIRSPGKRRVIYITLSLIIIVCCAAMAVVATNYGFG